MDPGPPRLWWTSGRESLVSWGNPGHRHVVDGQCTEERRDRESYHSCIRIQFSRPFAGDPSELWPRWCQGSLGRWLHSGQSLDRLLGLEWASPVHFGQHAQQISAKLWCPEWVREREREREREYLHISTNGQKYSYLQCSSVWGVPLGTTQGRLGTPQSRQYSHA